MGFSWNFRVSWGVLKKSWLERYIQLSFPKYLNQRVSRVHEQIGEYFKGISKIKKDKKRHEEIECHNSI